MESDIRSLIEDALKNIIENLPRRALRVNNISWSDSTVIFYTTEEDGNYKTDVNDDDRFKHNSSLTLSELYELGVFDILPTDFMAPVIIEATAYDNPLDYEDSLVLVYSEKTNCEAVDTPFVFYEVNGTIFFLSVSNSSFFGNEQSVVINSGAESLMDGDSVNILAGEIISDDGGKFQLAEENKKALLKIIRPVIDISVNKIVFLDPDGTGYPGIVRTELSETLTNSLKEPFKTSFTKYLEDIKGRKINVDSVYWDGFSANFITSQDTDAENRIINTIINDEDTYIVSDSVKLSSTVIMAEERVLPLDSMAPVLVKAECVDSIASDSISMLIMEFSEIIKPVADFDNDHPYLFKGGSNIFPVDLSYKSQGEKILVTVPVTTWQSDFWNGIDSVRIHPSFGISDGGTAQRADKNRMIELLHRLIAPPLKLKLDATLLTSEEEVSHIVVSPVNELSIGDDEEISGTVTIIDQVGNIVIEGRELEYLGKEVKKARFIWDGSNSAGRQVGAGTYIVVVYMDPYKQETVSGDFSDTSVQKGETLQGFLGVQR